MKNYLLSFLSLFLTLLGCAQPPADRARVDNDAFDKKISRMLRFSIPTISVDSLSKNSIDFILLDSRQLEEYKTSHIPNARWVGYNEFDPAMVNDLPKDQPIVVYCSIGYRSEKIGEKLQLMGFTNVSNLYGSIFEWANQGLPLCNGKGQPTNNIHTYNKRWSQWMQNDSYQKIW